MDRSELSGLTEKLRNNPSVERAGFVAVEQPDVDDDAAELEEDIADDFGIDVEYLSLTEFREDYVDNAEVSIEPRDWLVAYVETLGRQRMDRVLVRQSPVTWLESLVELIEDETGEEVDNDVDGHVTSSDSDTPDELQSGIEDFS